MRKANAKKRTLIAWSEDEVKLLKGLFPQGRAREIAERTGRSLTSVRRRAYYMGITATEYRLWSANEVNLLKKLYQGDNAQSIADKLGRTVSAIATKAHKLGLTEVLRVWSKRELNLLKRLYPSKTAPEIAEQIGRSVQATRMKIVLLGLRKRFRYDERHRVVKGTKEKLCSKCRIWKVESQFRKIRSSKDGLNWRCKECEYEYDRKRYERIRKTGRRNLRYEERHRTVGEVKQNFCRECNRWNNESEFYRKRSKKDGLDGRCKNCSSKASGKSYEWKRKGARKYLRYEDRHRIVNGVREKLCTKCRRWKKESDFYKSRSSKGGLRGRCRKCLCKAAGISRKK